MQPHPHRWLESYFSIFVQFFSEMAPHFLSAHDSPSNLAESRYPHPIPKFWLFVAHFCEVVPNFVWNKAVPHGSFEQSCSVMATQTLKEKEQQHDEDAE